MAWKLPMDSVLVPFDFSDSAVGALGVARTMVSRDEQVHVVFVTQLPSAADPAAIWGHVDAEGVMERAQSSLKRELDKAGIAANAQVVLGTGGPGDEIVDFAEQHGAQLIVMPSHGRSGIKRWLLGSVTERVMRLAKVPVLVLRADEDESA